VVPRLIAILTIVSVPAFAEPKVEKASPLELPWPIDGVTVGGRVFARETIESVADGPATGVMELESVRMQIDYEKKRVRASVEAELAGGEAKIRDAFLQLEANDHLAVRVGRFKLPGPTVERDSRWNLPVIDRGFLSDVYDDGLALAGRRVGAMVVGRLRTAQKPKLEIGAFQTLTLDGDAQAGTFDQRYGLLGIARGSIEPIGGLELAAWGSTRLQRDGSSAVPSREWTTGVDVTLDLDDRCGPRAWIELALGSSALDATPMSTARVHFVATRSIASYRLGDREKKHAWFLEPFASIALIDPDLDVASDVVYESALGVNAGKWRRWRVQLQAELRRAGEARPTGLAGDADLSDREAFTVQLGAAF
jgi:hypothetical protein